MAIAASPHSNAAAVIAHNRDAVSVVSYVMQCIEIPRELMCKQFSLLASVMKLPFHGFGKQRLFNLDDTLGIPAPKDLRCLHRAVAARAALKTVHCCRSNADELRRTFNDLASISEVACGSMKQGGCWISPEHWNVKPIALRLEDAAHGRFPNLKDSDRAWLNHIAKKTTPPRSCSINCLMPCRTMKLLLA